MLQMLHYQILVTLCYLFLTSTLRKMKYIRSNNCNFMTKELKKAIMNRSKLRRKFLKTRNKESRKRFNRQRNTCVSLLRKTKRRFFEELDDKVVSNNREFWKTVGPLFSGKDFHKEYIILNNNNKAISNNEELAKIFNKRFSKIVENLDIDETLASQIVSSDITDPAFNTIKKYEYHPSIIKIKHFMSGKDLQLSFNFETKNKILTEIHN